MADESLDTGLDGRTELRIHGVSGTPPEAVLDHPLLKRVAGDEKAGFYRRWYPGGRSADLRDRHRIEAYGWGNLTSGPSARAAWLLLLPFMLVNLAYWMLPAIPATASRFQRAAGRTSAALLRLFGLTLTLTLVLTAMQVAMDLVAWQCAGMWRCGTSSALTAPLTEGWLSEPGRRIAVSALAPSAILVGIATLGRRSLRRTKPVADVAVPRAPDRPMSHAAFWRGNPGMPTLRSAHVSAATALLSAAVAWPATTLAASGTMRAVGLTVCLAALAVTGYALVLVATEGVAGRAAHRSAPVTMARRMAIMLLLLAAGYSVWDHGTWDAAGRLPGIRPAILLTFGTGLILLVLLSIAVAAQRPWRQGTGGFRVSMRGFGTAALAIIAFLVAGGFSAGLTYRVADLLGYPVLSQETAAAQRDGLDRLITDESLPFAVRQAAWQADLPLVLPPSFAWAGAAATVILVAVLLIVGVVVLGAIRRIGPLADEIAREYGSSPGEPAVRRVATVVGFASLTDGAGRIIGRIVIVAGMVLLAGLGVYSAGVDNWQLVEDPPLSTLTAAGTWFMGAFAIGLVGLAWSTARKPLLRRTVGILWDVGSFWPRTAHPMAPPSYGERAVPDLVERVTALTRDPHSGVLLSGHSQGSVLAAATMMQLPRDVARRVVLVTHGSPLRRLYARNFPAYFDEPGLRELADATGGWRNLYRDTDPIGGWVLAGPDDGTSPPTTDSGVDLRLLDPPMLDGTIAGHGEYWRDPRYREELDALSPAEGES